MAQANAVINETQDGGAANETTETSTDETTDNTKKNIGFKIRHEICMMTTLLIIVALS